MSRIIADEAKQKDLIAFASDLRALCQIYGVSIDPDHDGSLNIGLINDARDSELQEDWPYVARIDEEWNVELCEYADDVVLKEEKT